jgi:diguanylate cyclase (GGDEF)-like protein/putative nucleotidyltransferase with HDIG domain
VSDTLDMSGATSFLSGLETLALAIGAQGSHAPDHVLRARLYAVELARCLSVNQADLAALQLAAILHDVGEMAVPQSILSKSDGLTPLEFEKMKTHAPVGALIAERAGLPVAAVRMVRGHHEHWDGSGYPDGLPHGAIPLGARILAVADCLASGDEALQTLRAGSGAIFDPRIVQVTLESYTAIEKAVREAYDVLPACDFRAAIGAARREDRLLSQLNRELGSSLSLPATMSACDDRLRALIGYDCIALYEVRENRLSPAYVNGQNAQLFCSIDIARGVGPSGMAAASRQAVLNGDPRSDAAGAVAFGSALAVALESGGESIAVLTLYRETRDAFGSEDLRILLTIRDKLAMAVEHALEHESADRLAAVDILTGLPNRRALFQRLDSELARCRRSHATLAVLVCEIDGLSQRLSKVIASDLRHMCREDDCVARMGEGFVLVLGGFSARDLPEKRHAIEALLAKVAPSDPLVARIGAAYYPEDGAYAEDLLACADLWLNAQCPA